MTYALRAESGARYYDGDRLTPKLQEARLFLDHEAARLEAAMLNARRALRLTVVALDDAALTLAQRNGL